MMEGCSIGPLWFLSRLIPKRPLFRLSEMWGGHMVCVPENTEVSVS